MLLTHQRGEKKTAGELFEMQICLRFAIIAVVNQSKISYGRVCILYSAYTAFSLHI